MHDILVHLHSILRWFVLLFILRALAGAFLAWRANRTPNDAERRMSLFAMITTHIQVLIGISLYFTSSNVQFHGSTMSNDHLRFFTVEHPLGMLIAVILVTLGYRQCKLGKARGQFWYFAVALLLILASIPWPFRGYGNGWY